MTLNCLGYDDEEEVDVSMSALPPWRASRTEMSERCTGASAGVSDPMLPAGSLRVACEGPALSPPPFNAGEDLTQSSINLATLPISRALPALSAIYGLL